MPGPRGLKEVGDPGWCEQTFAMLKGYLANIRRNWRHADDVIGELEGVSAWKVLGYSSFDAWCRDQLDMSEKDMRTAIRVERERVVPTHGGDRRSAGRPVQDDNVILKQGNDPAYIAGRLKRDKHFDLAAKVANGEMSAQAAGVQAKIRKPYVSVRADDPVAAMATLLRRYTCEELLAALAVSSCS